MVILMALACQPRVPTNELTATVSVTGYELDEVDVEVRIEDWDGDVFELREDDALRLTIGDEELDLSSGRLRTTMEVGPEAQFVTLLLDRSWDVSAEAEFGLPAGLAFTAPAEGDRSFDPLSDDIDLAWSPNGTTDRMSYDVLGDCVYLTKRFVGDAGVARIPVWSWPDGVIAGCEATITMNRLPDRAQTQSWSGFSSVQMSASRHATVDVRLEP